MEARGVFMSNDGAVTRKARIANKAAFVSKFRDDLFFLRCAGFKWKEVADELRLIGVAIDAKYLKERFSKDKGLFGGAEELGVACRILEALKTPVKSAVLA